MDCAGPAVRRMRHDQRRRH